MARPNIGRTREGESNLARRIAMERESRGWSYAALAEAMTRAGCTINASAIYKIEKGDPPRKISVDELLALADVFEVDLDNLLTPVEVLRKERAKGLLVDWDIAAKRMSQAMYDLMRATAEYELLGVSDPELQEFARNLSPAAAQDGDRATFDLDYPEGRVTVDLSAIFKALDALRTTIKEAAIEAVSASSLGRNDR